MIKPVFSIVLAGILVTLNGCIELEQLPPEPRIEFRDFTVIDTTDLLGNEGKAGKLTFYFEDGDGDIGLYPQDNMSGDNTNLFLSMYRKSNGIMMPAEPDDPLLPSPYRIPYLERLGQNKVLKGEITVVLLYMSYEESDTIMYDFHIRDRSMNLSNIETTCEIALNSNGSCLTVK